MIEIIRVCRVIFFVYFHFFSFSVGTVLCNLAYLEVSRMVCYLVYHCKWKSFPLYLCMDFKGPVLLVLWCFCWSVYYFSGWLCKLQLVTLTSKYDKWTFSIIFFAVVLNGSTSSILGKYIKLAIVVALTNSELFWNSSLWGTHCNILDQPQVLKHPVSLLTIS